MGRRPTRAAFKSISLGNPITIDEWLALFKSSRSILELNRIVGTYVPAITLGVGIGRAGTRCRCFRMASKNEGVGAGEATQGPAEGEVVKHVGGRLAIAPQLVCHQHGGPKETSPD
jgi:hypothetical protein